MFKYKKLSYLISPETPIGKSRRKEKKMNHFAMGLLQWLCFNELPLLAFFTGFWFPASIMFIKKAVIIPDRRLYWKMYGCSQELLSK